MATVLNRTTKRLIESANTPDYPPADWIHNPDLSAVTGFSSIYWIITGDVVSLMSQAERDAVDAAVVEASRDETVNRVDNIEDVLRASLLMILDELNLHADQLNQITGTVDGAANMGQFQANMQAVVDYPQRTIQQMKTVIRNKLGT